MTKHWFTCRVRYIKQDENGKEGKVTEQFLLDAYNYTEAEARMTRITKEMGAGIFEITQITKSNYAEVIHNEDGDQWYRVKIAFVSFDEESGKEKQANQYFLIEAYTVKDTYEKVEKFMSGTISNFVIPAISYTKIMDVFPMSEESSERNELIDQGYTSIGQHIGGEPHPMSTQYSAPEVEDEEEEEVPSNVDSETGEIID
ncbi:MAG: DUF4494 domain-containing protein [Flavobacteriales bacterium]